MEERKNSFEANQLSMQYIHDFHKLMENNEIILIYKGDFSQEVTKSMLSFTERKFMAEDLESITRKKVFNVMVESLQNVSKHQIQSDDPELNKPPIFMIGFSNTEYLVISGNPIWNDKVLPLKKKIEEINALDKDGLKKLYQQTRLHSKFSDVGGAGIGLIDMIRKSGNKLEYAFDKLNDKISYFSLMARITKVEKN